MSHWHLSLCIWYLSLLHIFCFHIICHFDTLSLWHNGDFDVIIVTLTFVTFTFVTLTFVTLSQWSHWLNWLSNEMVYKPEYVRLFFLHWYFKNTIFSVIRCVCALNYTKFPLFNKINWAINIEITSVFPQTDTQYYFLWILHLIFQISFFLSRTILPSVSVFEMFLSLHQIIISRTIISRSFLSSSSPES